MDAILIAKRLAAGRKQAALSQNQVAEALAVSRQAVSKWESGKAAPSLACCAALAALYHITPDELLTGKEPAATIDFSFLPEESLADRIRKARSEKGLSQGALAEALAVSRQSVSKWERGEAEPDIERLVALASLLSLPLSALLPAVKPASAEPTVNIPEAPAPIQPTDEAVGSPAETPAPTAEPMFVPTAKEDPKKEASQQEDIQEEVASEAAEAVSDSAKTESGKEAEPEESDRPITAEEESSSPTPAGKAPSSLKEQVRKNLALYKELLQKHPGSSSHATHTKPKEKTRKEENKKIAFRTIADIGPNDAAYVYVNKKDGKLRTILPLLASVPICTAVIALLIRREYKK